LANESGRHALDGNPLHTVSVWASTNRLVIGQERVDGKINEITAIPILLSRLDLREQVVTIDAMGCQRTSAAQIVAQGGDNVLVLQDTHPDLATNVRDSFALATADPTRQSRTVGKGHGRIETRMCRTITDPETLAWLDPKGAWESRAAWRWWSWSGGSTEWSPGKHGTPSPIWRGRRR